MCKELETIQSGTHKQNYVNVRCAEIKSFTLYKLELISMKSNIKSKKDTCKALANTQNTNRFYRCLIYSPPPLNFRKLKVQQLIKAAKAVFLFSAALQVGGPLQSGTNYYKG